MSTKTLTLQTDEDVLLRLEQQAQQEQTTVEIVAQEALRKHASSLPEISPEDGSPKTSVPEPFRIHPVSLGRCFLDDLSQTSKVLAWAEGEDFK